MSLRPKGPSPLEVLGRRLAGTKTVFMDLGMASDVFRRAVASELRSLRVTANILAITGRKDLGQVLEDEVLRRAELFERVRQERYVTPADDWSPRVAALESLQNDLQTGRFWS